MGIIVESFEDIEVISRRIKGKFFDGDSSVECFAFDFFAIRMNKGVEINFDVL